MMNVSVIGDLVNIGGELKLLYNMSLEMDEDSIKSEKSCGSSAVSVTPFSINDILNCTKPKESGCDVQERALDMTKKWNQSRGIKFIFKKNFSLFDLLRAGFNKNQIKSNRSIVGSFVYFY